MADATLLVEIKTNIASLKAGLSEAESVVKSGTGGFQNYGKVSTSALKSAEKGSQELKKSIEAASHEVTAIGGVFGNMARASRGIGGIFTASGAAEAVAGIAGIGVALAGLAQHTADEAIELQHLSSTTGVSVEALGAMKAGLERAGVSGDLLRRGLPRLEEKIFTAAEQSKEARDAFSILGLQTDKWSKQLPSLVEVLSKVNQGLSTHRLNAAQAAAVSEVFGLRTQELAAALPAMMSGLKDPALLEFGKRMQAAVGAAEEFKKEEAIISEEITEAGIPVLRWLIEVFENLASTVRMVGIVFKDMFVRPFTIGIEGVKGALEALQHGDIKAAYASLAQANKDSATILSKTWADLRKEADDTAMHVATIMAGRGPGGPPTKQVLPTGFGEGKKEKDPSKAEERLRRSAEKGIEAVARANTKADMIVEKSQDKEFAERLNAEIRTEQLWDKLYAKAEAIENKKIALIEKDSKKQEDEVARTEQRKAKTVADKTRQTTAEIQRAMYERYGFQNLLAEKGNQLIQNSAAEAIKWATLKLSGQLTEDKKSQFSSAKAGAAYAAKHLPFPINLVAAGVTFAALMSFDKGGVVPQTSLSMVHRNEMVLPPNLSEFVQRSAARASGQGEAGPGVHFNYSPRVNAIDGESAGRFLDKHGDFILNNLLRKMRSKNM
jgi:hypothetical protein